MLLADQWQEIETALPQSWSSAQLSLAVAEDADADRVALILASLTPGRMGTSFRLEVTPSRNPEGIVRRLDQEGVRGRLDLIGADAAAAEIPVAEPRHRRAPLTRQWDQLVGDLPQDWSEIYAEIELASSPGPGLEPLTVPEARANYARNQVSAAATAAAATERLPPFDSATFSHDRCVPVWAPGREVRFEMGSPPFGRTATFDWVTRTITLCHDMSETRIGFGEVEAVEARVVRVTHRSSDRHRDSNRIGQDSVTLIYHGEVHLHLRDGARPDASVVSIVRSGDFANPDGPYHQTLPLVTELSTALGVERRITDYK